MVLDRAYEDLVKGERQVELDITDGAPVGPCRSRQTTIAS